MLFSLISCVLVLGTLEVGWRLIHGWNRSWHECFRYHPQLGWCLRENYAGQVGWMAGHGRINAQGIRAAGPIRPKEPGEKRLLALGDSVTFGARVRTDETWPSQLEQRLHGAGIDWRVLNGGVTGYDPSQEVDWLELFGWQLEPDALAIAFCRNDVDLSDRAATVAEPSMSAFQRWLTDHSILANGVQKGVWRMEARLGWAAATVPKPPSPRRDPSVDCWQLVDRSYRRLATLAQARGLPVVLIIFPTRDLLTGRIKDDCTERLHALGRELGWTTIDVASALAGDPESFFPPTDSIHPNADGYERSAACIADVLMEQRFFSGAKAEAASAGQSSRP